MDASFEKFSLNFSNLPIAVLNFFLLWKLSLIIVAVYCISLAFFFLGRLLFQVLF